MDTERKLYRWSSEHFICLFYVMCPGDIVYTLPPLKNVTRLAYVKRPSQRMLKQGIYSWISICVEIIKWSTKSIGRFRWYNIVYVWSYNTTTSISKLYCRYLFHFRLFSTSLYLTALQELFVSIFITALSSDSGHPGKLRHTWPQADQDIFIKK